MITEKYAFEALKSYLMNTPEGRKILEENKISPEGFKEMRYARTGDQYLSILKNIANELATTIKSIIPTFKTDAIEIDDSFLSKSDIAYINIDESALRRESLHSLRSDGRVVAGGGIDDILALFTHGYTLKHRAPWGLWVRSNGGPSALIRAKSHRDPNDFLSELVENMNEKYKRSCVVSLNNKYLR